MVVGRSEKEQKKINVLEIFFFSRVIVIMKVTLSLCAEETEAS